MVVVSIKPDNTEEAAQEWENPLNPEKPGDERDAEQLKRQLKEAKRRKDNLTDDDKEEQEHTN